MHSFFAIATKIGMKILETELRDLDHAGTQDLKEKITQEVDLEALKETFPCNLKQIKSDLENFGKGSW